MRVCVSFIIFLMLMVLFSASSAGAIRFTYTLSGGLSPSEKLVVDDDITVYVNGNAVFVDDDGFWTGDSWGRQTYRGAPITFQASPGDTIRIVATNPGGVYIRLSPLYLHTAGQSMKLTDGVPKQSSNTYTFFDKSFTIAIPTGSISVSSIPSGAKVYVDGSYKGRTPLSIDGVLSGSHMVKVSKAGYNDEIKAVSVGAGQIVNLDVVLRQLTGSIKVTSNPGGASVYLDGVYKGTTPMTISNVPIGSHIVKLKKQGYNEVEKTVIVSASHTTTVSLQLLQQTGSIKVSSNPSGASVYLDGAFKGTTPIILSNVPVGSHTIKLTKSGYNDASKTVSVSVGKTTFVFESLTAQAGTLKISSTPSGADVYVDGVYRGVTPLSLQGIPVGFHRVVVKKFGYSDVVQYVKVLPDRTVEANPSMSLFVVDLDPNTALPLFVVVLLLSGAVLLRMRQGKGKEGKRREGKTAAGASTGLMPKTEKHRVEFACFQPMSTRALRYFLRLKWRIIQRMLSVILEFISLCLMCSWLRKERSQLLCLSQARAKPLLLRSAPPVSVETVISLAELNTTITGLRGAR